MNEGTAGHQPTREDSMQDPTTENPTMQHREERHSKDPDRDPEEIRRDIRKTRGEMDRTVDELVDRFSVGNLVDEAWQRMRRSGGGGPDVGGMLREHPVPIALVGLGLGWLAVEQASGRSMSTDKFGSESETSGRSGGTLQTERNGIRSGNGHGLDRDGSTEGDDAGDGNGITEKVSDQASDAMSTAREKVSDLKESTKSAGARTRDGFQELLGESPLTVGSIVFGLGLASGLAIPSSDLEDREMGEVSDRIKSEAGRLGSKAAERAGEVGHAVAETAESEIRSG